MSGSSKRDTSRSMDEIMSTITSAEHVINEVKGSGVDITESEKLLDQAMKAYQDKDDRKVMFFVKKAEALAKKQWKDYYLKLTEETLSSTRKLIDEVREAGLEPVEAEKLFLHALELVEKKNFKLAEEYIKQAVTSANTVWGESRSKVVSDAIASIHGLITEAKEIGVDVFEAEQVLLKAITHYKNEEFDVADELVKNAVIMARESWNEYRATVASEGISDMYNLLMNAKNTGMDTTKAENMLREAEQQFNENSYEDVEEIIKQVENDMKTEMQVVRKKEVEDSMDKVANDIDEIKALNIDASAVEELYHQTQSMFDESDYDSVEDYLKVIETMVQDAKQHHMGKMAAESITTTETRLREIETRVAETGTGKTDVLSETQQLLNRLKQLGETDETTGGELSSDEGGEQTAVEKKPEPDTGDELDIYEWGATYLCREPKSQKSFKFYINLLKAGSEGLCISRMHPDKLSQKYDLKRSTIWLSKFPCDTCRNPSNLGKLAFTINQFLEKNPASAIMLDGMEYLINNNDFQMVLRFIEDMQESIVVHDSIFIVPVSPASYDERELTLLERNSNQLSDNMLINAKKFIESQPAIKKKKSVKPQPKAEKKLKKKAVTPQKKDKIK